MEEASFAATTASLTSFTAPSVRRICSRREKSGFKAKTDLDLAMHSRHAARNKPVAFDVTAAYPLAESRVGEKASDRYLTPGSAAEEQRVM